MKSTQFAEDLVAGDTIIETDGYLLDIIDASVDGEMVKVIAKTMSGVLNFNLKKGTMVNVWQTV